MSIRRRNVTKKVVDDYLWVEKYRPQTIKDCILPKKMKDTFLDMVKKGEAVNLLLSGSPGTGKTTVAKALCNDLGLDSMVINASKDGNIDTLRTKIQSYVTTMSFDGKMKCVILDEADYLNAQSTQPALRNFIEENHKNCRFILTCNYPKRIIEPLHSRLNHINFTYDKADKKEVNIQFAKRLVGMLKKEGIQFEPETVMHLIKSHAPDYRKIINSLQGAVTGDVIENGVLGTLGIDYKELAGWIAGKKFKLLREWIAGNPHVSMTEFMGVNKELMKLLDKKSIPDMFIILNDFDTRAGMVSDMEIHLIALCVELMFGLDYE